MTTYRLTEDIDLRAGHYNPRQPRDSHGRWTSTPGGRSVQKVSMAGGGIVAFMQPRAADAATKQEMFGQPYTPSRKAEVYPLKQHPATNAQATVPEGFGFHDVAAWYGEADDTDKDNLSSDLGLDPKLRERSIKELKAAIKSPKTSTEERDRLKAELNKRIAIAKATSAEVGGWTKKLEKRLEDKPPDADLAPIIGETLAQHPKLGALQLGALAHLWDRLRLSGYNFKKGLKKGEFVDELPRILARAAGTVLMAFLLIHFGVHLPGLENLAGTAAGD